MISTTKKRLKQIIPFGIMLTSCLCFAAHALARSIPVETIQYPTTSEAGLQKGSTWDPQPIPSPWYVGGDIGIGESANSIVGLSTGANLGYAFNSNLAMEFDFLLLPFPNKKNNLLFATNAKISLPLSSQLSAFSKVGIGLMQTPDQSHFALVLGGGIDYFLQTNLSVGAQLLGSVGTLQAQSFSILASANYYFGNKIM